MTNLLAALEITALGMGLVFAALVLLWGLMALLTSIVPERSTKREHKRERGASQATPKPVTTKNIRARAAAIAVATALAEQQMLQAHRWVTPPTAIVSAWQLGMRTRQFSEKGMPRLHKPRRVG